MNKKKVRIVYDVFPQEIAEKVYGITTVISQGNYAIAINSQMPEEIQAYSLGHELAAIALGYTDKLEDFETFPQNNKLLDIAADYYEKYKRDLLDWDFTEEHNDVA